MQSPKNLKDGKKKNQVRNSKTFQHFERMDGIQTKRHDINPPLTSSSNQLASTENEETEKASTCCEEKETSKSSSISAIRRRE